MKPVLFIMGPTASGKTSLAMRLSDELPSSLISVDSALIYREMDIGTAKPTPDELRRYPHALVDIKDPTEAYSAAEFAVDARALIQEAHQQDRLPVLVGGTILYFKALAEGLADLPQADAALRAELEAQAQEQGWPAMHQRLSRLDPESGARLKPNDSQRIQRALEVVLLTGRPITEFWREQKSQTLPWNLIPIALMPENRSLLHQRIEQRFDQMLEQGFQSEVERLMARGDLHLDLPSMRCVGYRQMWQHLMGELDEHEMREKAIVATRQLAKRQLTWLRGWSDPVTVDPLASSEQQLLDEILRQIKTPSI